MAAIDFTLLANILFDDEIYGARDFEGTDKKNGKKFLIVDLHLNESMKIFFRSLTTALIRPEYIN